MCDQTEIESDPRAPEDEIGSPAVRYLALRAWAQAEDDQAKERRWARLERWLWLALGALGAVAALSALARLWDGAQAILG